MKQKLTLMLILLSVLPSVYGQGVFFNRDFSPAEGLTIPQESPYREEICLNGYWELQLKSLPAGWESGTGIAPELTLPEATRWEKVKIKIPSPINVNDWGRGLNVGEGTKEPYAPSSVYYPSYPKAWASAEMGWLKKSFEVPQILTGKRIILHFEAVAGECIVLINGKEAGRNFDSFLPFEIDITEHVRTSQSNELLVGVRHSKLFDKKHPGYPKFGATYPPGSNLDNILGIWQDVFLFIVPEFRITDVFVQSWLDRNELELAVLLTNQSGQKKKIRLEGDIKEWINQSAKANVLDAPEINWRLGNSVLTVSSEEIEIKPGETQKVTIRQKVQAELKKWSPSNPNLYTLLLTVQDKKDRYDCKATRFGWRQLTIEGKDFHLNGEKIQCFGDIQHPFSAYICSRRFAWAWYMMIKDFGGNAVRPHAQPWPRVYYDLADEMGLMVLDETALFGSSIRLNLEEDITWERSQDHLDRLILRDRNHPSVIGWSAGNEMFAIALLNKPEKKVADIWDDKLVKLALSAKQLDPTRDFLTLDGDKDMDERLPVWSKHFGHDLRVKELPEKAEKPLIVGESGATYYGRPEQLYHFAGDKAFESYHGRSEALAIDVYQNAVQMARPHLAYFSPSEVSWFGIEHQNLGYHDYSRLPNIRDGIFAGKPYREGKPGYQYERIPPYVSTFNPGLDPDLPLYKPLPMFEALKAALSQAKPQACKWDSYKEILPPNQADYPAVKYKEAYFVGNEKGLLADFLRQSGLNIQSNLKTPNFAVIDAEDISPKDLKKAAEKIQAIVKKGGLILVMSAGNAIDAVLNTFLPASVQLTDRQATALENNTASALGKYFNLPGLYFAEMDGDRHILKRGLSGELIDKGTVVLQASRTDWSLFNNNPENKKCAQIVLYEHIEKPQGAALVTCPWEKADLSIAVIDYRLNTKQTQQFWKNLFAAMAIDNTFFSAGESQEKQKKEHDLLLDGPVN
ncbi:MAG: beta-galactosidase [Dysgonamonadaceae bacterium]|jgi:beta-galactosidase|nr:beta-galactosidase [Dysgonamonadaceae bacterium]